MRRKTKYSSASVSLVITFILGVAVGFFLRYALFEIEGDETQESVKETASPVAPQPSSLPVSEIAATPADIASVWPARHIIVGFSGTSLDRETAELLNQYKPAGVWLRETNTTDSSQIAALVEQINVLAAFGTGPESIPFIVAAQEGGPGKNVLRFTKALSYEEISALDYDAIHAAGRTVAQQARVLGVNVLLAPTLDILDSKVTPPGKRPFFLGDMPGAVAKAGVAFAQGLMEGGVCAVARHYPGIGSSTVQPDGIPLIAEKDVDLLAAMMLPFAEAAADDISGILISNATIPTLDLQAPGRPALLSPVLTHNVLRNQWKYTGVLIADDVLSVSAWSKRSIAEDVIGALEAGCDVVLISTVTKQDMESIITAIKQAVSDGKLQEQALKVSRQRLDLWRSKLARQEVPATPGEQSIPPAKEQPIMETNQIPLPTQEVQTEASTEQPTIAPVPDKPAELPAPQAETTEEMKESVEKIHVIKPGENLSGIAKKYGVTVKNLLEWNNLSTTAIRAGDKLKIYSASEVPDSTQEEGPVTQVDTPKSDVPSSTSTPPPTPPVSQSIAPPDENAIAAQEAVVTPETPPSEEPVVTPLPPILPSARTESSEGVPKSLSEEGGITEKQKEEVITPNEENVIKEPSPTPPPPNTVKREHEVLRNTPLNEIAETYGVTVEQLREWNRLSGVEAPAGSVLAIYLPIAQEATPVSSSAPAEPSVPNQTSIGANERPLTPSSSAETTVHVVGPGDTLSKIAKKYGISVKQLIEMNNITNPDVIVLGTELKVPAGVNQGN